MLADSAILTAGERTFSVTRAPVVPPLDQVSDAKAWLASIDEGLERARRWPGSKRSCTVRRGSRSRGRCSA